MGLQQLAGAFEFLQPLRPTPAGFRRWPRRCARRADEVLGRIDEKLLPALDHLAADRMDQRELLDLVAPELDAEAALLVAGPDLDAVAPHAELARLKLDVAPLVLDVDQLAEHLVAIDHLAERQADHHGAVVLRRAQAVDARDAGDDDHVAAADQRAGGRQPQAVDLLVDRGVFFDVDVALRDVGFGLVVVVVADEVVDGVVGEEFLEFAVELGGQGLVVRHHQRGPLLLLDDVGHGEGLAGAGHAHEHLVLLAGTGAHRPGHRMACG